MYDRIVSYLSANEEAMKMEKLKKLQKGLFALLATFMVIGFATGCSEDTTEETETEENQTEEGTEESTEETNNE